MSADLHANQPVLQRGTPLRHANAVLIMLHGRGGTAEDILSLGEAFVPPGWAMLAPQAANRTWYPSSFLAPREQNEPDLSSALRKIKHVVEGALQAGLRMDQIVICGFSQGACLSTEYAATYAQRYGGVIAFTGGMIGDSDTTLRVVGLFDGTPILLSSGDPDPHVPWQRVERTAELFRNAGAQVTLRRFAGRPHTVSPEELVLAHDFLLRHEGDET